MFEDIYNFGKIKSFKVRPNAGDGLWVFFLLPASLILSCFRHPVVLTNTYKLTALLSMGLSVTSMIIIYQKFKDQKLTAINRWTVLTALFIITLYKIIFQKGLIFSIFSGLFSTIIYIGIYVFALKKFTNCFTIGEAGLVSQGFILIFYGILLNIFNSSHINYVSNMQISTVVIQFGLLGISIISCGIYFLDIKGAKSFYILTGTVIICLVLLPLHLVLRRSPCMWILNIVIKDLPTLKLIIYWIFCSGIAILAVSSQIANAKKASTSMRKIFHVLAVVVYIPGFLYKCSFLYLASGIVLCIFFLLEIMRILNIPPLGRHLQDGFAVYSDEKDVGILAMTPIYLLAGCSMPLWIHPSPCDVTDSAMFNLLPLMSGLLSIGVGDTAASIIGSNYGKHFWAGSKKTIEGTIACILAQIGLLHLLIHFDALENFSVEKNVKLYLAVFVGSIVEAKTTQIDNLVLPLIMYIILI